MTDKYGVYPVDPLPNANTKSIVITLGDQTPLVNPISGDFVCLNASSNSPILSQLKQPIKGDETIHNASIVSFSLNQDTTALLQKIQATNYPLIELKDSPNGIQDFTGYKNFIIPFLSLIRSKIILNTPYLRDTIEYIKDINKNNNVSALYVPIYGVCLHDTAQIGDLFNYIIDIDTLVYTLNRLKQMNVDIITEANPFCNSSEMTHMFGSQIWLYDFLFQNVLGNIKQVFINMSEINNIYTIKAFLYATQNNPKMYNINHSNTIDNIHIYALRNDTHITISVIHKNMVEGVVEININVPYYNEANLIRYLCNGGKEGTSGIMYGKLTYDKGQLVNVITETPTEEVSPTRIPSVNGTYKIFIAPMTICILKIPIVQTGGAYFDTISNTNETSTIITLRPNQLSEEYNSIPTTMTLKKFKKNYQKNM